MRILDIQKIYDEYSRQGSTAKWIFENKIEPVYRISRATFFSYLTTDAEGELDEIENSNQMKLF